MRKKSPITPDKWHIFITIPPLTQEKLPPVGGGNFSCNTDQIRVLVPNALSCAKNLASPAGRLQRSSWPVDQFFRPAA